MSLHRRVLTCPPHLPWNCPVPILEFSEQGSLSPAPASASTSFGRVSVASHLEGSASELCLSPLPPGPAAWFARAWGFWGGLGIKVSSWERGTNGSPCPASSFRSRP